MRHRDLESTLPFNGWWNNPITTVFTVKGCAFECVTCGSSHTTCTHLTKRQKPVYRGPASLVANMEAICRLTHGPIVLVGDLLMAGAEHARRCSNGCARRICQRDRVRVLRPAAGGVSPGHRPLRAPLEHGIQSREPQQAVRDAQEGEAGYTTEDMEAMIKEAVRLRCSRIDIFFMIGLPAQTVASVRRPSSIAGTCSSWATGGFPASSRRWVRSSTPAAAASRSPSASATVVRAHAGGAPPAAGPADLGGDSQLRDEVDDAPRAGRCDL